MHVPAGESWELVDQLPTGISAELYLSATEITQLIAEIERVRPAA